MSDARKECLSQFTKVCECPVTLVTPKNLNDFILPEHPLHPAYSYLSQTHKADYLRTYFMNFHGGGYTDIKRTSGSWVASFTDLSNSDAWICGYKEIPGGVAYNPYAPYWSELVGNCAYICKPQTPLTQEWYSSMIALLDTKLDELKLHPASHPQDSLGNNDSQYPIEWNEMLGRIFHRVSYGYKEYILNTLPICIFHSYR